MLSEEHLARAEGDKKLWPTVALAPTADYDAAPSIRRILFTPAAKSFMINEDGPVLKAGLEPRFGLLEFLSQVLEVTFDYTWSSPYTSRARWLVGPVDKYHKRIVKGASWK